MSFGIRLLFAVAVVLSAFYFASSKHTHKKSHGPLHPKPKKVDFGKAKEKLKGHIPKRLHLKKSHIHHHRKHKHHLKHKHQTLLHLKAHKKGVTYAKSPAEPQPCVDFLPCLQYRYYHCHSHEWIRNNCPKLCLYCEHQPFPEPMYGRFKAVAASYPDWCVDHSQCVAYPTEACAYDDWMKLNCLRKCDVCYKDKKVKAGLLFVGSPFDKTMEQKKEEHELNQILQFRPTVAPAKAKNSKLMADKGKATALASNRNRNGTAHFEQSATVIKDNPITQLQKPAIQNVKPPPGANPQKTIVHLSPKPVIPEKPDSLTNLNPPVAHQQSLATGNAGNKPNIQAKPAFINPPVPRPQPKAASPVGIPAYSYQDLVKQELQAAKEVPSTKQFKADLLKEVQIKLKDGRFPQVNTATVFVKHKVTKPKRKHVVESLHTLKHKVVEPKQDHLKDKGFHEIGIAHKELKIPKHKGVKPKGDHVKHEAIRKNVKVNKGMTTPKHKVAKPKGDGFSHMGTHEKDEQTKAAKHLQKKNNRKVLKKGKVRENVTKDKKQLDKVTVKERKAKNGVEKKSEFHSTRHDKKGKH